MVQDDAPRVLGQGAARALLLASPDRSADADGHCEDSTSWYKKDDTEKDCAWVKKLPDSRCAVKSSDKTLGSDACPDSCGMCEDDTCEGFPQEPIIPGMMPGTTHPRILLGIDVDYPPYATLVYPASFEGVCDIEVTTIQAGWAECWTDGHIGDSLLAGYYHGCQTYTHTIGARNRYMEFSTPILDLNKECGFIAMLDDDGNPVVSPTSDLSEYVVVDVTGWAPTADTVSVLQNDCNGGAFFKVDEVTMLGSGDIESCDGDYCTNENDKALKMLMNGQAHAIYIYSDQAYNYMTACAEDEATAGYAYGGTTLSMSKKGAGLKQILDPCIDKLIETETYYDICAKWT
ncbi:FK506 binding protein [Aureococcus anophagefferens]|nr:FK506 binding protein [Aureococcus anophagefferens]